MDIKVKLDLSAVADHIAALRMVLCDLSAVIHEIDPDGIEDRLRGVRVAVQEMEQAEGAIPHAQQLRLEMLEQCADRDRLWRPSGAA